MKKNIFILFLISYSLLGVAQEKFPIAKNMLGELTELHKQGVKIQAKYEHSNNNQLRECVEKHGHLRDQAKAFMEKVRKLKITDSRMDMTFAAGAAFECVYCGGRNSLKKCAEIPPILNKVNQQLADAK